MVLRGSFEDDQDSEELLYGTYSSRALSKKEAQTKHLQSIQSPTVSTLAR